MVSIENKVYVIGGVIRGGETLNDIYELECVVCEWRKMNIVLQKARRLHVAFPIPDSKTHCTDIAKRYQQQSAKVNQLYRLNFTTITFLNTYICTE